MRLGSERARRPGLKTRLLLAAALVSTAAWSSVLWSVRHLSTGDSAVHVREPRPAGRVRRRAHSLRQRHPPRTLSTPRRRSARLVDRVNALNADLILLGGDYVYSGTKYEASCFSQLSRLQAPLGCFAVLGNHDYGRPDSAAPGPGNAIKAAAEAGIPLLRNEGVWLERDGRRIRLGGVADYKASTSKLAPWSRGRRRATSSCCLSHHPDFSEDLPKDAVDLVLSGHTHGGRSDPLRCLGAHMSPLTTARSTARAWYGTM